MDNLSFALKYAAMGWPVVAVKPDKTPATLHGVKDATTDERVIRHWYLNNPQLWVAIAAGHNNLQVVDVDPRNGGDTTLMQFESEHGPLPETATSYTRSGGSHYWYRVPDGFRIKKIGPGIDVLGLGKYCIEEGSEGYSWEGAYDPLDGFPIADAPGHMLEPVETASVSPITPNLKARGFLPEQRINDLRSALSYISPDEYERWINVGQALHSTDAGNQAFGLWEEWSKGSDKYQPGQTQKKWRTFKSNGKLNVESIFAWATNEGWVNTATLKQTQDDELLALAREAEKMKHYETVVQLPTPIRQLPVKTLANIASWITSQMDTYHPQAVNAAVLCLASALAARNHISAQGDPLHLYLGTLCQSVSSIRTLKGVMQQFLAETGQRRMIRGTRLTSLSSVYRTLERHPVAVYIADDYGQMLNFARRQPSGILDQALNAIADVYYGNDIYVDPDLDGVRAQDEHRVIYQPAIGLLAMISDDQLALLTKRSEVGRGSLQQMIMVDADTAEHNDEPRRSPVPDDIKTVVMALQQVTNSGQGNLTGMAVTTMPAQPKRIDMTAGALAQLSEFDQKILDVAKQDRRLFPLATGARQNMRRLLSTLAVWNDHDAPQATPELAKWSGEFVLDHFSAFADRFIVSANDTGDLDVSQEVLSYIIRAGVDGMTQREITQYCWQFRKLNKEKRSELLLDLLANDEAVSIETKNKQGKRYISRKFVQEVARQV